MNKKMTAANSRNIDIIRIISAWVIMLGHGVSFYGLIPFKRDSYFQYLHTGGLLLFFILAGFLTDYTLQQKPNSYKYMDYLKNRFHRIYIYFIPCLLFTVVTDFLFVCVNPQNYPHYSTFNIITFLKNVVLFPCQFEPFGTARPLWCMRAEWWLFLGYGYFILVFMRKCKERKFEVKYFIFLMVFGILSILDLSVIYLFSFLMGVLINRLYKRVRIPRINLVFVLTVILFLVDPLQMKAPYTLEQIFFLSALFMEVLMIGELEQEKEPLLANSKFLKVSAGYTFPLFLVHYTIMEYINYNCAWVGIWKLIVSVVISNFVAWLFYYICKRLGHRKIIC